MSNDHWMDERTVIRDNAFHRAAQGVRNTQVGMKAMNATQTMRAMSSTQARMPAMNAAAQTPNVPQQLLSAEAQVQYFMQQAPAQPVTPQATLTEDQVEQMALFDAETRTYKLKFMLRMLQRELNRALYYKRPFSIMVVALPELKKVELRYGLLAYSIAMKSVTQALLENCGPIDMVGRYQDDRFLFVLPEKEIVQTASIAEQLCLCFRTLVVPFQNPITMPAAIGYASFCEELADLESLIAMADLGADLVIQRGGDGACFAPNELD